MIQRYVRHILANGPHLVSPQEGQELTGTFILGAIGNYFRTIIGKHPVSDYIIFDSFTLYSFSDSFLLGDRVYLINRKVFNLSFMSLRLKFQVSCSCSSHLLREKPINFKSRIKRKIFNIISWFLWFNSFFKTLVIIWMSSSSVSTQFIRILCSATARGLFK